MPIEEFALNGENVNLSLNAEVAPTTERAGFDELLKLFNQYDKNHALRTDRFVILDNDRGISIAAQIMQWDTTGFKEGEIQNVIVPGDELVYAARARVTRHGFVVIEENIMPFNKALALITEQPTNSKVHLTGDLQPTFEQHEIGMEDLGLDLESNTPYQLRWHPRRRTLFILPGAVFGLLAIAIAAPVIYKNTRPAPVITDTAPVVLPPSRAEDTFSRDMLSLARLLEQQHLLVLNGLNGMTITLAEEQFELTSTGTLIPITTLARIRELAAARGTTLDYDGETWTMIHASSRYKPGTPTSPVDLYPLLDRWRVIATIHDMPMRFVSKETLHDAERFRIQITMSQPMPANLRALAADIHSQGLKARTETIALQPAHGDRWSRGWDSLTIEFTITGTNKVQDND